jgi:hypothetical protein
MTGEGCTTLGHGHLLRRSDGPSLGWQLAMVESWSQVLAAKMTKLAEEKSAESVALGFIQRSGRTGQMNWGSLSAQDAPGG